jgi:PAS domain S-box-containing protein
MSRRNTLPGRPTTDPSLARLAAIVAASEDAIISKTLDGTVTSWNPAAERLYGYTAAEMLGQPIARLVPPEDLDELPSILHRLRLGQKILHYETLRIRKG